MVYRGLCCAGGGATLVVKIPSEEIKLVRLVQLTQIGLDYSFLRASTLARSPLTDDVFTRGLFSWPS
jgi:hypothetical protein